MDKNREKDEVYGDRLKEIDQGLFGTVSSEEPFSDDSQTRSQPFTGQSSCLKQNMLIQLDT